MFDWIIEADIVRLDRAIGETTDDQQRARLMKLRAQKCAILEARSRQRNPNELAL